jgi:hypothetical protein
MTQEVIDAVLKADVRCILSKGWSDRISPKDDPSKPRPEEPHMPPEIHVIKSAPHDWLFSQIDAAAHHGGSGTTGASLRAGIPTIIRPFFGDQFFFATRVEDLGVGVWVRKWGTNSFGRALWEVTRNERMIVKARVLGEQIRSVSQASFLILIQLLITRRSLVLITPSSASTAIWNTPRASSSARLARMLSTILLKMTILKRAGPLSVETSTTPTQ